jgi:two-component sensor histidine kinase
VPDPELRSANPRDELPEDPEQALERLFLERARLGLKLILCGIAIVFVGWLFISGGQPRLLSVCHVLNFLVVALALRMLRDPGRPTFNHVVGFVAYAVTIVLTGYEGVLAGDSTTPVLILLGMAVIAATLVPWSFWWQLGSVVITIATAAVTVAMVAASHRLFWLQNVGALAPTLIATVFLCAALGRQRAAAARAERERRSREASLREANRRLEQEIEEHRKTELALREANRRAEREIEKQLKTEAALRFAMRELDHRIKNTLATVQSVADQTLRSSSSMSEFSAALSGRIQALARIHGSLAGRRWEGMMLTELVELVVGPYRQHPGSISVDCDGSFVWSELVRVLGMTLHELATNAAKYGALSRREGRVAISSRIDGNGSGKSSLHICWAEHDGPPVSTPARTGFGMRLIEEALPYEIAGSITTLRFPHDGLRCDIAVPCPPTL